MKTEIETMTEAVDSLNYGPSSDSPEAVERWRKQAVKAVEYVAIVARSLDKRISELELSRVKHK